MEVRRKKHDPNVRRKVLELYDKQEDWNSFIRNMDISYSTAYKWIRSKRADSLPRGGARHSKKSDIALNSLISKIEETPSITLRECAEYLEQNFELNVSISTVKNWLDNQLLSLKIIRPIPNEMNSLNNKELRFIYVEQLLQHESQNRTIIWVDETNFNLFTKRKFGRSKIGTRSTVINPTSKGSNLHCIGAMSSHMLVDFRTKRGAFKMDNFNEWISDLINISREKGLMPITIVCDNARAHNRIELEEGPDVKILRLGPYSYLLNPIEKAWSIFKEKVKCLLRTEMQEIIEYRRQDQGLSMAEYRMQRIERIANEAKNTLTNEKISKFACHVRKYYANCLQKNDLMEID